MIFGGAQSREEILSLITKDRDALDNIIAMANVGAAFTCISIFEDLLSALSLSSKTQIELKLRSAAISEAELFVARNAHIRSSTLGKLITALERSGIDGRDIRYLRAILQLRNDFVHRFLEQVPLPGDWERFNYKLEDFSEYTRHVTRHISTATRFASRIMYRNGLLAGKFGSFGALLWNPDGPIADALSNS